MKLLFVQDGGYYAWAGGMKANRFLALELAARAHDCRAVVGIYASRHLIHDVEKQSSIVVTHSSDNRLGLIDGGMPVTACLSPEIFEEQMVDAIEDFDPDLVVFAEMTEYRRLRLIPVLSRCVVTVHLLESLPFGPLALRADPEATRLFRMAGGTLVVSEFMKQYLHDQGVQSGVVRFPAYGRDPFPEYGRKEGIVLLINAAGVKGLPILLALADRFPEVQFGAVPSWGTSLVDILRLKLRKNIRILRPTPKVDTLFEQARILLVPSLCQEAFGLVVIEAMLRRIPVIAANVGGLPEAKLGTDYVLPVEPIRQWRPRAGRGPEMEPVIPEQDIRPWAECLSRLLTDDAEFDRIAETSRERALEFVRNIDVADFETFFDAVRRQAGQATLP